MRIITETEGRVDMDEEFTFLGFTVPKFAMVSGGFLVAWGIIAYLTQSADPPSITAAIPAFIGLPMLGLGVMAERDEKNLRHYMHTAMIVALAMVLMPIAMFWRMGAPDSSLTLASLLALLLIGATFIFAGVRSFRHARMLREAGV